MSLFAARRLQTAWREDGAGQLGCQEIATQIRNKQLHKTTKMEQFARISLRQELTLMRASTMGNSLLSPHLALQSPQAVGVTVTDKETAAPRSNGHVHGHTGGHWPDQNALLSCAAHTQSCFPPCLVRTSPVPLEGGRLRGNQGPASGS